MDATTIKQLEDQILNNLAAPEEVQTDSGRVKNQSVGDQIKALNYLKQQRSAQNGGGQARRVGLYKISNND